jgi:molybdopterin-biosynthesis enzyme MoeA-like protein
VFTVGGLGPTSDDRTLEGVALGLGVELRLHEGAERMVAEKYAEFHASGHVPFAGMNESRRKMARLPAGAEPIVNPIGGAPAVLFEREGTAIVSLPGVPGELEAIVNESLDDLFSGLFGTAHYEEHSLLVELQDESAIAEILRAAEAAFPAVYVKSRAKVLGSTRAIRVTLSARGEGEAAVAALLTPAAEQLLTQIAAAGYGVSIDDAANE